MARVAGINIPDGKRVEIALTYIYGIGLTTSKKILKEANVDPNTRAKELNENDMEKIRNVISKNYQVEGDLRLMVSNNIRRLKDINSYRGTRHIKGLPSRGQKTKTNARTKKGKKKTIGSGRKTAGKRL